MEGKIYRSRTNSVFAGVCGGIAEYFDFDPSIVRIVTALLIIPGGLSIWVYIIAALIIPKKPLDLSSQGYSTEYEIYGEDGKRTHVYQDIPRSEESHAPRNVGLIFGLILIGLGAIVLLRRFLPYFHIPYYITEAIFPGLLILGGIFLIFGTASRRK